MQKPPHALAAKQVVSPPPARTIGRSAFDSRRRAIRLKTGKRGDTRRKPPRILLAGCGPLLCVAAAVLYAFFATDPHEPEENDLARRAEAQPMGIRQTIGPPHVVEPTATVTGEAEPVTDDHGESQDKPILLKAGGIPSPVDAQNGLSIGTLVQDVALEPTGEEIKPGLKMEWFQDEAFERPASKAIAGTVSSENLRESSGPFSVRWRGYVTPEVSGRYKRFGQLASKRQRALPVYGLIEKARRSGWQEFAYRSRGDEVAKNSGEIPLPM